MTATVVWLITGGEAGTRRSACLFSSPTPRLFPLFPARASTVQLPAYCLLAQCAAAGDSGGSTGGDGGSSGGSGRAETVWRSGGRAPPSSPLP